MKTKETFFEFNKIENLYFRFSGRSSKTSRFQFVMPLPLCSQLKMQQQGEDVSENGSLCDVMSGSEAEHEFALESGDPYHEDLLVERDFWRSMLPSPSAEREIEAISVAIKTHMAEYRQLQAEGKPTDGLPEIGTVIEDAVKVHQENEERKKAEQEKQSAASSSSGKNRTGDGPVDRFSEMRRRQALKEQSIKRASANL